MHSQNSELGTFWVSLATSCAEIKDCDCYKGDASLLYNGYRVVPGGKVQPGRDADPSTPSSAEVKNRVELYFYSP